MSDYNKLAVGYSNFGVNIAHDPKTLPFGKFSVLNNAYTEIEGELTTRKGTALLNQAFANVTPIIGVRRLNDSIRGLATYVVRTNDGVVYWTDSAGAATVSNNFTFTSAATGLSSHFGSIAIDRTSRSNQIWAYVGDSNKNVKLGINGSAGVDTKNVGIARPTGPPTFSSGGGGSLTALATYNYRYTLYDNNTGVESLFNSVEATEQTLGGGDGTITVTIPTETVDSSVTHVRIYRTGGTLAEYQLVTSVAYTGTTVNHADATSDESIAAADLLDTLSDKPFTTTNASGVDVAGQPLPQLFGPVNGYMFGCGDPQNPGYIYWCNKFNPDSQNPNNRVEVSSPHDPIMNGFMFDGKAFVFTKDALYQLILGLGTSTWTPFLTGCSHGLITSNAFCVGPEVYFLGKDGLYATSGGIERILTDDELRPIFQGQNVTIAGHIYWQLDYTQEARMDFHNNHLWFQYVGTDGNTYLLVWSAIYKRWYTMNLRAETGCIYDDEKATSRLLFGGSDGNLYLYFSAKDSLGTPDTIPVQVTTGLITLGSPLIHKEWGALIFDLNPQSATIYVTVYANRGSTIIATASYSGAGRVREFLSLGDYFSEDLIIDIQWASRSTAPILYGYEILYRKDAIQMTRWASRTTDLGISGWKIVRSGYVTLLSNIDTTLSITNDAGTVYTYTIPSTGGVKKKVFVTFDPIKGKLFKFILTGGSDDITAFRLYNAECAIHAKPWLTSTGYSDTNPFMGADGGGEVGAQDVGSNFGGNRDGESIGARSGASGFSGNVGDAFSQFSFLGGGAGLTPTPASATISSSPDTGASNGNAGGGSQQGF